MFKKSKINFNRLFTLLSLLLCASVSMAQVQNNNTLNTPPDISKDFEDYKNTYYLADELASFNPETGQGTIKYLRYNYATRQAFNNILTKLVPSVANEYLLF
tara:strand:- start:69165 stop:69470 length:306 start_codon:yes stop_codon:yes gene_type:complete